jgi:hypothetical protein
MLEPMQVHHRSGTDVVGETLVGFLCFTDREADARGLGPLGKIQPPIRSEKDRRRLWRGLREGALSTVGTDCVLYSREQKFSTGFWDVLLHRAGHVQHRRQQRSVEPGDHRPRAGREQRPTRGVVPEQGRAAGRFGCRPGRDRPEEGAGARAGHDADTERLHRVRRRRRGQRSEVRDQRSEVRGQRSEIGGQRSEIGDQRSEVRDRRSEIGGPFPDLRPPTSNLYVLHFSSACWNSVRA